MKGYVHSIESFSTLDGPGIRGVVFLQGCPLRCVFCHNPDSWIMERGKLVDSAEVIARIRRNLNYLGIGEQSGVTISGGEPTYQIQFLLELLKGFKAMGLHTAVDTSGYVSIEDAEKIVDYVDLFIVDIKHMDAELCQNITGQTNLKTFAFLDFLARLQKNVWIRNVLLSGITDKAEHVQQLGSYLASLNNVSRLELLPCHNLAEDKYRQLGLKNVNDRLSRYDETTLQKVQSQYKRSLGIPVVVLFIFLFYFFFVGGGGARGGPPPPKTKKYLEKKS
jgi:pyruvate formate lyase activating enzyme